MIRQPLPTPIAILAILGVVAVMCGTLTLAGALT